MTLQQPLFMQAGQYTAAADRYLIGAFLYPGGGDYQFPRPGVRPFGTIEINQKFMDQSFRVMKPTGSTTKTSEIEVGRGAAFVAGPSSQELNGVYLVVNTGSETVDMLGSTGSAPGRFHLYLTVHEGETVVDSYAQFVSIKDDETPPSESVLHLASVTLDSSGVPTNFEDQRVYTTTHGGVLLIQDAIELTNDALTLISAPLGSQAYSIAQKALFTRTVNGWEMLTNVKYGDTSTRTSSANSAVGSLFYDSTLRTLQIFAPESPEQKWLTVGEVPGLTKFHSSATYTNERRHTQTAMGRFAFQITPSSIASGSAWVPVHDGSLLPYVIPGDTGGSRKPTTSPNNLEIKFMVMSNKTIVTAVLSTEIVVRNKDAWNTIDLLCEMEVALEVQRFSGSGTLTEPISPYRFVDYNYPWIYAGMRFHQNSDGMKSRTVLYELPKGEYLLRPMFHATASDGVLRTIDVTAMAVEASI